MELTCPKCQGPMRTYERNGVHVDQCTECRGIFLDRGELERLVDAERAWHADAPGTPSPPPAQGAQPSLGSLIGTAVQQHRAPGRGGTSGYGRPYGKRKKSFLEQLFD